MGTHLITSSQKNFLKSLLEAKGIGLYERTCGIAGLPDGRVVDVISDLSKSEASKAIDELKS